MDSIIGDLLTSEWMPGETKDMAISPETVISEDGEFEGYAAWFGNEDSVKDIIEPGAFKGTLSRKGHIRPLLWQHDRKQPIGFVELAEDGMGLAIKRAVLLQDVQKAKEAYALLKARAINGLSIGYDTVKHAYKGSVRLLKELELYEVSVVTFPANELATVTRVKAEEAIAMADSTGTDIVEPVVEQPVVDAPASEAEETAATAGEAAKGLPEALFGVIAKAEEMLPLTGTKAGRRISQANRALIEGVISTLTQLLESVAPGAGATDDEPMMPGMMGGKSAEEETQTPKESEPAEEAGALTEIKSLLAELIG